jgi:hypothetical protein
MILDKLTYVQFQQLFKQQVYFICFDELVKYVNEVFKIKFKIWNQEMLKLKEEDKIQFKEKVHKQVNTYITDLFHLQFYKLYNKIRGTCPDFYILNYNNPFIIGEYDIIFSKGTYLKICCYIANDIKKASRQFQAKA